VELCRAPGLAQRLREVKDERRSTRCVPPAPPPTPRWPISSRPVAAAGAHRAGGRRRPGAAHAPARRRRPSFDTIVAAGANSAIPHHQPTDAVLAAGDLVKMDFGALRGGYHSDMTRTVVLGRPADWQRELYQLVRPRRRLEGPRWGSGSRCPRWTPPPGT